MLDPNASAPVASFQHATFRIGNRTLWEDVCLDIQPGEFIAVLGPNGAGKTTMLKALLGERPLASGKALIHKGMGVGYVPQARQEAPIAPMRGRDLVGLGLDGHRAGLLRSRGARERIDTVLEEVGAAGYADAPTSMLSGGELQRLRVACALVSDPDLLLCDEPLASLDPGHQNALSAIIAGRCGSADLKAGIAVLFVTHEITPVLPYVNRVIYIAGGSLRVGSVDEVMRSDVLSHMYGQPVDVLRHEGSIIVLARGAGPDQPHVHGLDVLEEG
ncbi:metal ABC transporter ATP-binding protein [Devriesea agamarum]|uniref:metal ABC transporter ATP-binding protein n=1 Tax=Devriesea agamarum TaxID=472569 RepID=UPI000A04F4A5|nr:metal ABC transporter ATP-binding protein [Devriesea agamarum]